jgi:hypothetical protein
MTTTRLTPESLATIRREAAPRSVSVRILLAELDAVTAERDREKAKAELISRQRDRYLPCPDHRDKVDGSCLVCALERARKGLRRVVRWGEEQTQLDDNVCSACSADEATSIREHYSDCPGQAAAIARAALVDLRAPAREAGPPRENP